MSEKSYVLSGFEISNYAYVFSTSGVKIRLNNAALIHPEASSQALGFYVSSGTEADASLVLSPGSTNYIEAELIAESGTPDTRAFWDMGANGGSGAEYTEEVDTVINLKLSVSYNVSGFTDGKIPLYKVTTAGSSDPSGRAPGVALTITDCRPLFFRLGTGGSSPDPDANYSWDNTPDSAHSQLETPVTAGTSTQKAPFQGADKNIRSLKEWMDAVMTELIKVKGSSYWYSKALSIPEAYQNSSMRLLTGGTWQHSSTTNGKLSLIDGTTIYRLGKDNTCSLQPFSGLELDENPCLFVILPDDETVNYGMGDNESTPIVPKQVESATENTIIVEEGGNYVSSGGNIRIRNQVFSYALYAPETGLFSSVNPDPTGLVKEGDYVYQEADGVTAFYHYGPSDAAPGVADGVSEGAERVLWLAYYDGSSKIHLQNGKVDLEAGEQIQQGDNTSQAVLDYIGSTGEADSAPVYSVLSIPDGTDLTTAIKTAFEILEEPIYDEILQQEGGWSSGDIVTLPPQSKTSGVSPRDYLIGTDELEIYRDGMLLKKDYDYTEYSSTSITLLRDITDGSYLRFRIASLGGSISAASPTTLQDAYTNNRALSIVESLPVTMNGQPNDVLLHVYQSAAVDAELSVGGASFQTKASSPISSGKQGFWVKSSDDLLRYSLSDGSVLDVGTAFKTFSGQAQVLTRNKSNQTGATIAAGSVVYLKSDGTLGLADSNSTFAESVVYGVTMESIATGSSGKVAYSGTVSGALTGLGITTGSYVYLSSTAGFITATEPSSGTEFKRIVGVADGNDLILQINGAVEPKSRVRSLSSSAALSSTDDVVLVSASGGAVTVTLPTPVSGKQFDIKKTDSSTNAVTIVSAGGATIDGAVSKALSLQYASLTVISNGSNYFII